jgi:hypothetical protein
MSQTIYDRVCQYIKHASKQEIMTLMDLCALRQLQLEEPTAIHKGDKVRWRSIIDGQPGEGIVSEVGINNFSVVLSNGITIIVKSRTIQKIS